VSKPYLDGLPALTDAETVRFFDGAIPSWRHAQSPRIPRLSHAEKLRDRITGALAHATASAMQLIRAAGGEGKSTAMLQAAVDVVRTSDILALHHVSKDARLHPNQIETLDPDAQWLIVADDADELIEDLWGCAERLHALGRTNVFFLIAARDADWRLSRGDQKGWATRLTRLDDLEIGGIEASDAGRIVQAWERYGDAGLRLLGNVPTSEERAERLVKAARAQDVRGGDGSEDKASCGRHAGAGPARSRGAVRSEAASRVICGGRSARPRTRRRGESWTCPDPPSECGEGGGGGF
jgi:hypothetical protein